MTASLTTRYLGFDLANPIIASASPMTGDAERLERLEEAGVAAVVLPSIYEEQIEHEAMEIQKLVEFGADTHAEALSGYLPEFDDYSTTTQSYLRRVEVAKETVGIPVIASLNGTTRGGWVHYARQIQDAGADALELNVYLISTDPWATGTDVEARYLDLVEAVRSEVDIPLAVKIGPYFSSFPNMAKRLIEAGADGLVLFNRFFQPDIDLDTLKVVPKVQLSPNSALLLPLRWIGIVRRCVTGSIAITSGVQSGSDGLKALLVGADAVMVASELLRHGTGRVREMLDEMQSWLDVNEYESVEQMKGSMSLESSANPEAFVRSNYMEMLTSYTPQVI